MLHCGISRCYPCRKRLAGATRASSPSSLIAAQRKLVLHWKLSLSAHVLLICCLPSRVCCFRLKTPIKESDKAATAGGRPQSSATLLFVCLRWHPNDQRMACAKLLPRPVTRINPVSVTRTQPGSDLPWLKFKGFIFPSHVTSPSRSSSGPH